MKPGRRDTPRRITPDLLDFYRARAKQLRDEAVRRCGTLRVLYAETHEADIELTRRHLSQHAAHIRLEVVHGAAEVMERLPQTSEAPCPCDVLLLDYRLPGDSALGRLRNEARPVPIRLRMDEADSARLAALIDAALAERRANAT